MQIGIIQAVAGFYTYLVVLNDYGYPPKILPGLGLADNWGKQVLWCKFKGGKFCSSGRSNGVFSDSNVKCGDYNINVTNIDDAQIFWDPQDNGEISDCQFALQNFKGVEDKPNGFSRFKIANHGKMTSGNPQVTFQSMDAVSRKGFYPYYPYRSRKSSFFDIRWLKWNVSNDDVRGLGSKVDDKIYFGYQPVFIWGLNSKTVINDGNVKAPGAARKAFKDTKISIVSTVNNEVVLENATFTMGDKLYKDATKYSSINSSCSDDVCLLDYKSGFTLKDGENVYQNVMSRQMQFEALSFAQGAFFVTIVVVQWADLLICKTRMLSIKSQGMKNKVMNFGLMFETILAAYLCYIGAINIGLGTRNLRLIHWFPGLPFSMLIFIYDETRKYLMRSTSKSSIDKETGRVIRDAGWLERNTYY